MFQKMDRLGAQPATSYFQAMGDGNGFDVPEIGFPSYHGNIDVEDKGYREEVKFTECQGLAGATAAPVTNLE